MGWMKAEKLEYEPPVSPARVPMQTNVNPKDRPEQRDIYNLTTIEYTADPYASYVKSKARKQTEKL